MEEPEEINEEESNASEMRDIQEMDVDEIMETDTTEEKANPDDKMTEEERQFYNEAMEYMDIMVENMKDVEDREDKYIRRRDLLNDIIVINQRDKAILANRIIRKQNAVLCTRKGY